MPTDRPSRPLAALPIAVGAATPPRADRHETILEPEPAELAAALDAATGDPGRLRELCARNPATSAAWALLGESLLHRGDPVLAYAAARVGYHRGLDALRRNGWAGTGRVHWTRPGNRGFLRALRLLAVAAAAIGETDEAARCRAFLLELDPDDGVGAASWPQVPGPGFDPGPLAAGDR